MRSISQGGSHTTWSSEPWERLRFAGANEKNPIVSPGMFWERGNHMPRTHLTVDRKITVFWKNDTDFGFMMSMTIGEHEVELLAAMYNLYEAAKAFLLDQPEKGRAFLIAEIEDFAKRHNAEGRPSYAAPDQRGESVAIMMKVAALENLDMIVSDEYTGVVASAWIEAQFIH